MDSVARVRRASTQVAKVRRRIWLFQALFWPVVAIGSIVAAVAVGSWAWRRRSAVAAPTSVLREAAGPSLDEPAAPVESRANTAVNGSHSG